MMKYNYLLIIILAVFFGLTACDNEEQIIEQDIRLSAVSENTTISENGKSASSIIDATGGTIEFDIQSTVDWFAEPEDAQWVALVENENKLSIKIPGNQSQQDRSVRIDLKSTEGQNTLASVLLNQKGRIPGAYDLSVELMEDDEQIFLPGDKSEYTVKVNTDSKWTADAIEPWINIVEDQESNTFTVIADENITFSDRIGSVIIRYGTDNINESKYAINVNQFCTTDAMVMVVKVGEETGNTVMLPFHDQDGSNKLANINCLVDWGNGKMQRVFFARPTHKYDNPGTYKIRIYGEVESFASNQMELGTNDAYKRCFIAVKNWGNIGLRSLKYAFVKASNLAYVAAPKDDSFNKLESVYYAFNQCESLTEIPDGFFANAPFLNEGYGAFEQCTNLKKVPDSLFAGCDKLTRVTRLFWKTGIETIGNNIFDGCVSLNDVGQIFYQNEMLTSIPADLFEDCVSLTGFSNAFGNCTSLTSIPVNLFANCVKAENFSYTFRNCTALTSIPEGLFSNNPKVTNFSGIFYDCTALASVPANLFAKNPEVTNFSNMFRNCTSLTAISVGVFDNNVKVTSFSNVFNGCTLLEGESPYTIVDGIKVHLYERDLYPELYTMPKTVTGCFKDCVKLTDYTNISENFPLWI
mgnify:CR=1 FL=1